MFIISCEGKLSPEQKQLAAAQEVRNAGLEYLDQNKFAEAEAEFKKLIELAPDEIIGYVNLGIVYIRQNKLAEAEIILKQALDQDGQNVTVRLNLFDVYEKLDDHENAISQLTTVLEHDPENLFALYKLSEKSQTELESNSMNALNPYLLQIIEIAPTNIVPRIYLLEYLLENKEFEKALEQMEDIQSKFERLPPDAKVFFDEAYDYLRGSQTDQAYTSIVMFHNQLKLTTWYQADIRTFIGSEDSRVGTPVISFSRKMGGFENGEDSLVYRNIKFIEVAKNAALFTVDNSAQSTNRDVGSLLAVNDFDNDGDQDLLFGLNNTTSQRGLYLFSNDLGRFQDVIDKSGIPDSDQNQNATFLDYDNDGFLDLVLISDGSLKLYQNVDQLAYNDVTESSGLEGIKNGICALSFDSDHDGDLDLFIGTSGSDLLFQNNGNGSFTDISRQAGIASYSGPTLDALLGDFDDDGDVDFFIANQNGNKLYSNTRLGTFEDATVSSGLYSETGSRSASQGDYNNDGFLDLFTSDHEGRYKLYQNRGKEGFVEDAGFKELKGIEALRPYDHTFFDFDNDGFLDLILAGDPLRETDRSLILLRNSQQHSFNEVSWILPESLKPVRSLAVADYNEDSDLDVFVGFEDGTIGLLRNDGGNMNYQLKIQLVGLREGSGKNNFYGIGSKVEVRVGPIYQMRTITSQSEYFGLGGFERADILRIRWTNGVPQNIFSPLSDRDLIEQQKLKGSCPFLYTWNGEQFAFVKDMMWRSALGMPMGIMTSGDSRSYAYPDASREYLRIPGEALQVRNGEYQLKITGELWETIYFDQLKLYAVDHPVEVDFRVDEKFVIPPFPKLKLYPVKSKNIPLSVTDGKYDLTFKAAHKDNIYIDNFKRSKFQGITELKDLIIDLGEGIADDSLYLFLNGWIFPSDASINLAVSQDDSVRVYPPYLQVINKQGDWETVIDNVGFPLGKNKTVIVNLSNVFKSRSRKIRIRTSMQIYWDHIFYSHADEPFKSRTTEMTNIIADLHYRGFSEEFRKGGRNGPQWFNYLQTTTAPKWMDLEGFYTRYGDVAALLTEADDEYIIYNAGDEISISFLEKDLPELPDGWQRDFVIYSVGWVKDGDMNTAYGQTVTPLPFHGMTSYPYPDNESYPYQENSEYIKEYNTREIDSDNFRRMLQLPN